MNKLISALIVTFIMFTTIFVVSAHPGRTDSSGGHYNRSTGEYHYHHGYSAHQHPNGECPYDFDDKTDRSSSSGSSVTTTVYPTIKSTIQNIAESTNKKEPLISYDDFISYSVLLISLCGCIFCPFWIAKPQNNKDKFYAIYSFIGSIFMLCLSLFLIFA